MENKQQKIHYRTIMDLGFKEEIQDDNVYEDEFGFEYSIITLKLTKKIYLDWCKDTQLCEIVRIDNNENMNIKAERPIFNKEQLIEIIDFFRDK